jgi:hypothetical protein
MTASAFEIRTPAAAIFMLEFRTGFFSYLLTTFCQQS